MVAAAAMSVPTSIAPVVSIVTWTMSGRLRPAAAKAARAPFTAALAWSGSWQVSIRMASAPPSIRPCGLDGKGAFELAVGDMAQARQPRAGADRTDDEAGTAVAGQGLDRLPCQLGRAPVDLDRPLLEAELAQRDRRAAEAVGLDRVGPGAQVAQVDLADEVGPAEVEDLRAVLLAPEVVEREVAALDLRPHRSIEEKDALAGVCQKVGQVVLPLKPRPGSVPRCRASGRSASGSSARLSA